MYSNAYIYIYIHIYTCIYIYICTSTCIYTYIHMYTHHIYKHIYWSLFQGVSYSSVTRLSLDSHPPFLRLVLLAFLNLMCRWWIWTIQHCWATPPWTNTPSPRLSETTEHRLGQIKRSRVQQRRMLSSLPNSVPSESAHSCGISDAAVWESAWALVTCVNLFLYHYFGLLAHMIERDHDSICDLR